jgi:hypothetical protein
METSRSSKSKYKSGRKKPLKKKLQKRKSCSESNNRLRGFIRNMNPSGGGKQQFNVLKLEGSTSTEKEQDLQISRRLLRPFTTKNRGKSLRSNTNTTKPTPTHLHHTSKCHHPSTHHHHPMKFISNLHHNMVPQTQNAHQQTTCNSHHGPHSTEPHHHLNTKATPTLTNF